MRGEYGEPVDRLTQKIGHCTNTTGQWNVPVSEGRTQKQLARETKVWTAKMVKNKKKTKRRKRRKQKERIRRHKTAHKKEEKIQSSVGGEKSKSEQTHNGRRIISSAPPTLEETKMSTRIRGRLENSNGVQAGSDKYDQSIVIVIRGYGYVGG